jgi:hypothetical protein
MRLVRGELSCLIQRFPEQNIKTTRLTTREGPSFMSLPVVHVASFIHVSSCCPCRLTPKITDKKDHLGTTFLLAQPISSTGSSTRKVVGLIYNLIMHSSCTESDLCHVLIWCGPLSCTELVLRVMLIRCMARSILSLSCTESVLVPRLGGRAGVERLCPDWGRNCHTIFLNF